MGTENGAMSKDDYHVWSTDGRMDNLEIASATDHDQDSEWDWDWDWSAVAARHWCFAGNPGMDDTLSVVVPCG